MAQEYESLAARLGGATGGALAQGIGGAAQQLGGLISQRINRLSQQEQAEEQRGQRQKFLEAVLPEDQRNKARDISYGTENLIRDYVKNIRQQEQTQDLERMFNQNAEVPRIGNSMGAPASIEAGIQEPEMLQSLPDTIQAQKLLAETLRERRGQTPENERALSMPSLEQFQLPRAEFARPEDRTNLAHAGLLSQDDRTKFVQNMQNAPIDPNLPEDQKRKAAAHWAALNQIAANKNKAIENSQLVPSYVAANSVVQGNPEGVQQAYKMGKGSVTPEQYLNAQRQIQDAKKQGRLWNQKYIENKVKIGDDGEKLSKTVAPARAILKSGAPIGVWQEFSNRLGIPISARDTRVEILDKIFNDIVVKASEIKGRMTNALLGFIDRSKARIINSPQAADFILDTYDYIAQGMKIEGQEVKNSLREWGDRPLPQSWWTMVDENIKSKTERLDDIYAQRFSKSWGIPLEKSPYALDESQLGQGFILQNDIQDGTVFEKNGKPHIMIGGKAVALKGGQ